jgi:hypothetical protein
MDELKDRWMREVEEVVDPRTGSTIDSTDSTASALTTAAASLSSHLAPSSTSAASTTTNGDGDNQMATPSHPRHGEAALHPARVHLPFGDPALTTYGSWHGDDDPALSQAAVGLLGDEHALFPQQHPSVGADEEWL